MCGLDLVIAAHCGLLGLMKQIQTLVCRGRGARTTFLSAVENSAGSRDLLLLPEQSVLCFLPTMPPQKAGGEQCPGWGWWLRPG